MRLSAMGKYSSPKFQFGLWAFHYQEMSLFSGNVHLKVSLKVKSIFGESEFQWNLYMYDHLKHEYYILMSPVLFSFRGHITVVSPHKQLAVVYKYNHFTISKYKLLHSHLIVKRLLA